MTRMVTCQSTNLMMTQTLNPRIRAGNLLPLSALHLSGGARLIRSNSFTTCVVYLTVAIFPDVHCGVQFCACCKFYFPLFLGMVMLLFIVSRGKIKFAPRIILSKLDTVVSSLIQTVQLRDVSLYNIGDSHSQVQSVYLSVQ